MITDWMKAVLDRDRLLEAIGRNDPRPLLCEPGRGQLIAFRKEMEVRKTVADMIRAHQARRARKDPDLEKLKASAGRMRRDCEGLLDYLGLGYLRGESGR